MLALSVILLFPYFLIPTIPQALACFPPIHSNFWLSLNAKDIFPTYWENSVVWGLPGLHIDILKSSSLWVGSQRLLSCWKILFCMLETDITLLLGCHFFWNKLWSHLGQMDGYTQKGQNYLSFGDDYRLYTWFEWHTNYLFVQDFQHLNLVLGLSCSQYCGPSRWNLGAAAFFYLVPFVLNFEKHTCSASLK